MPYNTQRLAYLKLAIPADVRLWHSVRASKRHF